mmetsp:Transcript_54117/g.125888  ORF Transcript_54117/g.125888 Transcript_54117/m.125888 type:complete len:260 (+) Transcript_54117:493-1272(+)
MKKIVAPLWVCFRRAKATKRMPHHSCFESSATSTKPKFSVCHVGSRQAMATAPATGLTGPTVRKLPCMPASLASLSTLPTSLHSWKPITSKGLERAAAAMRWPALALLPWRCRKRFHQNKLYDSTLICCFVAAGLHLLGVQSRAGTPTWHQWPRATTSPLVFQPIAPGSGFTGPSGCRTLGFGGVSTASHTTRQPQIAARTSETTKRLTVQQLPGRVASASEEDCPVGASSRWSVCCGGIQGYRRHTINAARAAIPTPT